MGSGGNAAGSGATQAGAVACTYGPQFIEASRPERRAARGRAPEAARQHCPFSIRKSLYRATNRRGERYRPSAGKPCPSAWKALWALSRRRHVYATKCPSTRHYLRATSDNRRSVADLEGARLPSLPHRRIDLGSPVVGRARADEQTVLVQTSYGLVPIGWVQSTLRVLDDAPNQREGAPRAWIRFDEQVAEGAKDLRPGDQIVVLTWLHLSPRDELSTHPEGDLSQPLTGVFSTCSPNRPNPIGLHRARIVAREGLRIEVDALEAIDGTPVVDVKPAINAH